MARSVNKLSTLFVNKHLTPGYYLDGAGLYLQISKTGTKSWIFKYSLNDRTREMGLGSLVTFSLAEARDLATVQRKTLFDGKDPISERDAAKLANKLAAAKSVSFDFCADKCINSKKLEWTDAKNERNWRRSITDYVSPHIGMLPVADVDVNGVLRCLEPIWATKTVTASRVQSRIANILDWATSRGYRSGDNPARWQGHLENLLAKPKKIVKVEHHPALPYLEMFDFVAKLRSMQTVPALALEFTILTAARTNDTLGAVWSEIDLTSGVWTIPAERMKADREHRVPLSERALEILKMRREASDCDYVFSLPGKSKHMSPDSMRLVLAAMSYDITVHGFRATFRSWVSACTAYPRDVAEMALAHAIENKVEEAYQRDDLFDKRRRLMSEWATYCATERGIAGNVVPMQKSNPAA